MEGHVPPQRPGREMALGLTQRPWCAVVKRGRVEGVDVPACWEGGEQVGEDLGGCALAAADFKDTEGLVWLLGGVEEGGPGRGVEEVDSVGCLA